MVTHLCARLWPLGRWGAAFTLAVLLLAAPVRAQQITAPVALWDRRYGGTDEEYLQATVATADGGYLLAGLSGSGATGDKTQPSQGQSDYWVMKFDAAGTKQWDRRYGGTLDDYLSAVCPAPNGGYLLAGRSRSGAGADKTQPSQGRDDYWLVRISGTGTQLWDARLGGAGDDTDPRVVALPGGGLLVAGTSDSGATGDKTQPSQGLHDFWAVRLGAELPLATAAPQWGTAVVVYPNPAHAACTVTLPARAAGAPAAALTLFDVLGRRVQQPTPMLSTLPSAVTLPLDNLAAGVYLLRVAVGDAATVRRLEIQ